MILCSLVCFINYKFKLRMSIARNSARQQQNKEMKPAYNDTIDAFHNTETNKEYMDIGEPSYINLDARGLV